MPDRRRRPGTAEKTRGKCRVAGTTTVQLDRRRRPGPACPALSAAHSLPPGRPSVQSQHTPRSRLHKTSGINACSRSTSEAKPHRHERRGPTALRLSQRPGLPPSPGTGSLPQAMRPVAAVGQGSQGGRDPVGLDYSIWLVGGLRSSLDALLGRLPGGAPPAQLPGRAGPERGVQRRRASGAAARERRAAPPDQQGPLPAR